jgi:hypothetical protein
MPILPTLQELANFPISFAPANAPDSRQQAAFGSRKNSRNQLSASETNKSNIQLSDWHMRCEHATDRERARAQVRTLQIQP